MIFASGVVRDSARVGARDVLLMKGSGGRASVTGEEHFEVLDILYRRPSGSYRGRAQHPPYPQSTGAQGRGRSDFKQTATKVELSRLIQGCELDTLGFLPGAQDFRHLPGDLRVYKICQVEVECQERSGHARLYV